MLHKKYTCPVDNGKRKAGEWQCHKCNHGAGIGCFYGRTAKPIPNYKEVISNELQLEGRTLHEILTRSGIDVADFVERYRKASVEKRQRIVNAIHSDYQLLLDESERGVAGRGVQSSGGSTGRNSMGGGSNSRPDQTGKSGHVQLESDTGRNSGSGRGDATGGQASWKRVRYTDTGLEFYQTNTNSPATQGSTRRIGDNYVISLFQGADLSTVSHETAHVMQMEMQRLIESGQASEQLKADWEALQEWQSRFDDDAELKKVDLANLKNQHPEFYQLATMARLTVFLDATRYWGWNTDSRMVDVFCRG